MAEPEPRRVADGAAFIGDAPFEVLKALLGHLSPKFILRMRSICRAWRDSLDLWAAMTLRKEPRPLLCFDRVACPDPDRDIRLKDYCIESLDLSSGEARHVLQITDSEYYDNNYVDGFKQMLLVHASLDGYLLVSLSYRWYVINPATRQWVALPTLAPWNVIGFYEHALSGQYCVLFSGKLAIEGGGPIWWHNYHVLPVSRPVMLRSIGRPISSEDSDRAAVDHGLRLGVEVACVSPPIQFSYNRHLHWPPQESQGYHMLVFDTDMEVFSWKRPPPVTVTVTVRDQDMRLLEFPNGDLGLSVSRKNSETLELWCLEDYQNEVWVLKHRIQLALQQMPVLRYQGVWIPAVVSPQGDVLIEFKSQRCLLHCDRNGNLLRRFRLPTPNRVLPIRHVHGQSFVQHQMFLAPRVAGSAPPPFFRWL